MESGLGRQLRFSMFLQAIASLFFAAAFVLRVIYSGIDFLSVLFLFLAVAAGSAAVWLFRKVKAMRASSNV